MKNQYVGDIGDYGKYGLLRFLADHGIKIGINWYLTENDGSSDGKFTDYLKRPSERIYDPELFDVLQKIADCKDKNVKMIEQSGIIPGAEFFSEVLRSINLEPNAREWRRRMWFNNSTLLLRDSELIFSDPDNGISYSKTARTKDSEKFILPEDVCDYYNRGKNVVFYCHKGRRTQEAWDKAKLQIKEYIRDAQILAVTCHRGTQRSYIFVLHPDTCQRYKEILNAFLNSVWGRMFTWESPAAERVRDTIIKPETINRIRKFTSDREWEQYHTPANLAKSISIEAAELLECFQWSDTDFDLEHVKEELADVMVYCRNLLDELGLDEDEIINAKMTKNEAKYPVEKARGSAAKYDQLKDDE